MSDAEVMDSDGETYLPASQMIEPEKEKEKGNENKNSQETGQDAAQAGKSTRQKKKDKEKPKEKEPAGPVKDPCIFCGKNCTKGTIQCTICALWAHMACTGLSKEALKGLEVQAKEVGRAYWACRSCMNFNTKWNNQMREVSKRQDETETRVANNSDKIDEVMKITEDLRRELREQARKTEGIQERIELVIDEEMREREARKLNLVIHGLPEPDDRIKEPKERIEQDKIECEKIFIAMKARTRYEAVRFCRRIGERGEDPRPLVIGVYNEDEKRHLLEKARELLYTHFENVTIVPDMTKSQRRGEQRLRQEADQRNTQLTEEDRTKNLKWLVVGKRGEKRLIKGVERDGQRGRQEREHGASTARNGWNPQIRVNSGPNRLPDRRQNQHWGTGGRAGGVHGDGFNNGGRGGFNSGGRGGSNSNGFYSRDHYSSSNNGFIGNNRYSDRRQSDENWRTEQRNSLSNNSDRNGGGLNFNSGPNSNINGNSNYTGGGGGGSGSNGYEGDRNSGVGPATTGNSNISTGGPTSGGGNGGDRTTSGPGINRNSNNTYNTQGASGGVPGGGELRPTEAGARIRDGGAWAQHPENTYSGDMDRQESQQAGWQAVEGRHHGPPLLPRPPIRRTDTEDQEGRSRLSSNKRPRSYDREAEEEEQFRSRNQRY